MNFTQCSGCGRSFGNRGYSLHLARTLNPRCRLAYTAPHAPPISQPTLIGTHSPDLFTDDTVNVSDDLMGDGSDDPMGDGSDGLIDNAAAEDADILEILGESDRSTVTIPEQAASDEVTVSMPPPETTDLDIQSEATNLEPSPPMPVVIDPFPHGSPGAPISQRSHIHDTDRDVPNGSIWAPFSSQCDWKVAHWAKMRGPSSSATADLLAIPEVWLVSFRFRFITDV
jgi:hypothetical protein